MELTFIAIVLLAAAWAALLLPDLRRRQRGTRRNSIESFSRQLSTLQRTHQGPRGSGSVVPFPTGPGMAEAPARRDPLAPRSAHRARQRRQAVFAGLVALAVITLWATVALSTAFLLLHLAVDALLAGYVWLLVEHRNRAAERRSKLRVLHQPRPVHGRRGVGFERAPDRTATGG